MSFSSEFDDTIRICEFYADSDDEVEVDLENYHIRMGEYDIDPVMGGGHLSYYLVVEPDGTALFVDDLDSYFQSVLSWEEMS